MIILYDIKSCLSSEKLIKIKLINIIILYDIKSRLSSEISKLLYVARLLLWQAIKLKFGPKITYYFQSASELIEGNLL
jgi:hypothetical protein